MAGYLPTTEAGKAAAANSVIQMGYYDRIQRQSARLTGTQSLIVDNPDTSEETNHRATAAAFFDIHKFLPLAAAAVVLAGFLGAVMNK